MDYALKTGVDIILYLQRFSPGGDLFFKIITFLGNEGFYLALLPLVYWCFDKKAGIRLTIVFLFSAWVNSTAKILAAQPRPFQYDTRVIPLVHASGGGLPSGHTQNSVVVWGYLAGRIRRPWAWAGALLLICLIPLSRLYLGVHFPTDLLGGYLLGFIILIVFNKLEPVVSMRLAHASLSVQVLSAVLIPSLLLLVYPGDDRYGISISSAMLGAFLGLIAETKYLGFMNTGTWGRKLSVFAIGMVGLAVIYIGLKFCFKGLEPEAAFRFIRYLLVGFYISFLGPWMMVRIGLMKT